jgi:5'-phosphate synthase pdxT subunit
VIDPRQESLGLLDATIRRNAYGRQIDSFEKRIEVDGLGEPMHAVFIRAPRFTEIGHEVEVLARLDGEPVLVRQGRVTAATFHPELTSDLRLHRQFLDGTGVVATGANPVNGVAAGQTPEAAQERRISC